MLLSVAGAAAEALDRRNYELKPARQEAGVRADFDEPGRSSDTIVVLNGKKAFPDLWGEGADNISGGSSPGSVKFFITSLEDSDTANFVAASPGVEAHYTGTFRGALNLSKARHIIPRVSGNIALGTTLNIDGGGRGNLSYHGHLAPEGGLAVTNAGLRVTNNDNVSLRFLRLRFGAHSILDVDDVMYLRGNRMAVDHVSLAWGADETFTIGGEPNTTYEDIIVQNTIIGQCRDGHSTGSLIGFTGEGDNAHGAVSWHNNVYVGVTHRTPNIAGDTEMYGRIYNNIAYDWSSRLTNVVGAPKVDVAHNYYKNGPAHPRVAASNFNQYQDLRGVRPYPPSIYTAGNIMPGVLTDPAANNEILWTYFGTDIPLESMLFRSTPLAIDPDVGYEPSSAQSAYDRNVVGREAGANRTTDTSGNPIIGLDSIDEDYLAAITNGTDARSPEVAWIHPPTASNPTYLDLNWNGIADGFEATHGIAASGQVLTQWNFGDYKVRNNAGYDAFEIYSAWVAGDFERLLE